MLSSPLLSSKLQLHHLMAVEARHMNLLSSQLIRDFKVNSRMLNTQTESGLNFPATMPENLVALYQSSVCDPVKTTDSGLSYHLPAAVQRKRPRDSFDELNSLPIPQKNKLSPLIDDDLIIQIQQHQSEIDRVVAQYAEKVRLELEERRKQESRMLMHEIYSGIQRKVKEKDEEIQRMRKLNWVLQERVKSLCVENQIWRDLAQSNEFTANSLRTNLEHVLAQERHQDEADDAESSCGSSGDHDTAAERRTCRKCGERESCVLVLPCRHLCLCTTCGSTVRTCPLCNSPMNASVHVNMS